jgi:hypothetical protein
MELSMSENHNLTTTKKTIPNALGLFVRVCPALLPDEEEDDYSELFQLMSDEIAPTTNLEWFAVADIVDMLWDMARLRLWKNAILVVSRRHALQTALLQTFPSDLPKHLQSRIAMARREAEEWRTNPEKREVLEERLSEAGYDIDALNAGAMIEAMGPLEAIDRFLCSARRQLNVTLREIGVRREFAERARKAFDGRIAAELKAPAVQQIETRQ